MKAAERRKVIDQRCGKAKSLDGASEGENWGQNIDDPLEELRQICDDYFKLWWKVESEKYDEEFELMKKEYEVAYGTQRPLDTVYGTLDLVAGTPHP